MATEVGQGIARQEGHGQGGGLLREAVFGLNDGLLTTLTFAAGVTGAALGHHAVVLSIWASAIGQMVAMGAGAYLSAKAEQDVYRAAIAKEQWEIKNLPEVERHEVVEIFKGKGFSDVEAESIADRITRNEEVWLNTMLTDELGLVPSRFENPLAGGLVNGIASLIGSLIPGVPYFLMSSPPAALPWAFLITLLALFTAGALRTLFSDRRWLRGGIEMAAVAMGAALVGYYAGKLLGVTLAG